MNCPHCQVSLAITQDLIGKRVKCSFCQNVFAVPPPPPEIQINTIPVSRKQNHPVFRDHKTWLKSYMQKVGQRSFIFQVALFAWTCLMILLVAWLMFNAANSSGINSPYASERANSAGLFMFAGLLCPMIFYLLLAVPLGIAAIATLETRKS